jgi:hypothetical protein
MTLSVYEIQVNFFFLIYCNVWLLVVPAAAAAAFL